VSTVQCSTQDDLVTTIGIDEFVLPEPSQILSNLDVEWRLQLTADKWGGQLGIFFVRMFDCLQGIVGVIYYLRR
jgi:hypothetical protein